METGSAGFSSRFSSNRFNSCSPFHPENGCKTRQKLKKGERVVMAKMVTRTVVTTNCNVFGVNPNTEECIYKNVVLSGTFNSDEKTLKAVHKVLDTDDFTVVKIVGTVIKKELRAMDEDFFLNNSVVIPNRK